MTFSLALLLSGLSGLVALSNELIWYRAWSFASKGTASSFTQLAMAILVYGAAALVIGTGLIGAMRRR